MKSELSGLDVRVIVRELREQLVGSFLDKAYQPSYEEVLISITGGGHPRRKLLLHVGRYICISSREREMPQQPSPFAMLLRKHVSGARIVAVEQLGFDRIVVLTLHVRGEEYTLVCELFRNGTVILVRGDTIVKPLTSKSWGSREVKAGEHFQFPPARPDPTEMDFDEFTRSVRGSDSDVVRTLAARLGLGGEYSEALLAISRLDPKRRASELDLEELGLLYENMNILVRTASKEPRPHIVRRDGEPVSVLPIELSPRTGDVLETFETFNDAVDAYFTETLTGEEADDISEDFMGRVHQLRHQAKQQREAEERYEQHVGRNMRRGDLVYANYKHCEAALKDLLAAKEELGWTEVQRRVENSDLVKELNTHDGYFVLPLSDGQSEPEDVPLRLTLTVPENAEFYYERGKRAREKSAGAHAALQETLQRLERAEERLRKARKDGEAMVQEATERQRQRRTRRRHFWFERFRWTVTPDGAIVVAGKDASSNERVVKRYLKDRDRYCHADYHGAPSVVVKDPGEGVPERSAEEGCAMAVIYSRAWSAGRASADAYWVLPEQVSKTPQSGEFVPKGAFIIRGRRNYLKDIEMRLAIGQVEREGEELLMGGPPHSVKSRATAWVELVPSNDKKEATAREVAQALGAELDEVMPLLPPGGSKVVERHGLKRKER